MESFATSLVILLPPLIIVVPRSQLSPVSKSDNELLNRCLVAANRSFNLFIDAEDGEDSDATADEDEKSLTEFYRLIAYYNVYDKLYFNVTLSQCSEFFKSYFSLLQELFNCLYKNSF